MHRNFHRSILHLTSYLTEVGDVTQNAYFVVTKKRLTSSSLHAHWPKYVWGCVSCAIGINCQFANMDDCFNRWLKSFSSKKRKTVTVGVASVSWSIWKTRNMACFHNQWPGEPFVVIGQVCRWIDFWSILQGREDVKMELQLGAKMLGRIAEDIFNARKGWRPSTPRLEN